MFKNIVAALAILVGTSVYAEELAIVESSSGQPIVVFYGDVTLGSADRLDAFLNEHPEAKHVGMVSPGGVAEEGYAIAEVLSRHGVTAVVPEGFFCLSACAIGFLGADEHIILGVLGFHNMYIPDEIAASIPDLQLTTAGQIFGVRFTTFLLERGFEAELALVVAYVTTPERFIVFTSTEDLYTFKSGGDNINDYLEENDFISNEWVDTHLWGNEEFDSFLLNQ